MARLKSTDIEISSFQNAMIQFDEATKRMQVNPALLEVIKQPRKVVIVNLPVRKTKRSFDLSFESCLISSG